MKKDFFKPIDFTFSERGCMYLADIANAKLNAEIEKWPKLYKYPHMFGWSEVSESIHTPIHTARLAFIEEIKPKECEHNGAGYRIDMRGFIESRCDKCGIKLRAKWEVAE